MSNLKLEPSFVIQEKSAKIKFDRSSNSIDTNSYHKEELLMNKAIIINAIIMIWFGIITIIGCIFVYILGLTNNIYITLSGVFIDFFSGTILYLVNNSTKTKNEYFKESAKVDSEKRIIELINSCTDEKFKQKQIDKITDWYCQCQKK